MLETHTSVFAGGEGTSYDRLEFIGDAILDFREYLMIIVYRCILQRMFIVVARYIWERHPYLSPGGLTMLKASHPELLSPIIH